MKHISLFVIICAVFISCKGNKPEENQSVAEDHKYYNAKDEVTVFDTLTPVEVVNKEVSESWKGYRQVTESLVFFKKNTPNEVLGAAEELVKDVVLMRDSISIETLDVKGMRARINALYNQSLRLQEMKSIPAITVPEISEQIQGLFSIYRTINQKINAIYEQVNFEQELKDDSFFFSKIDSIQ